MMITLVIDAICDWFYDATDISRAYIGLGLIATVFVTRIWS